MPPRTQYAKHGDLNIAYQVTGDGPIDILVVPSFVSNIEFWWAHPTMKAWWDRVTSFARLILFDKLGTGCSDPVSGPRTLEQRSWYERWIDIVRKHCQDNAARYQ